MMFRCPACRTRRSDYGLFTKHLRETGHKVCNCAGYHFQHRPGSPLCWSNPMSEVLDAKRRGEPMDVLLDIAAHCAWEYQGKKGGSEPPF